MKQARKFVTSLLAVLLLFSTLTVGFAAEEQAVAVDFEDIPGIIVGNWTDTKNGTGCTAIIVDDPAGGVAGVDVRGGSPATRETDLLDPTKEVQIANAICLSGGSAFGLDAAGGVPRPPLTAWSGKTAIPARALVPRWARVLREPLL